MHVLAERKTDKFWLSLQWEPRDLWVGVFWKKQFWFSDTMESSGNSMYIYVCILPCFPVCLQWER